MDISEKISLLNESTLASLDEVQRTNIAKIFTDTGIKILGADFGFMFWNDIKNKKFDLGYVSRSTPYEPREPRPRGYNYLVGRTKQPFLSTVRKEKNQEYDLTRYMKSIAILPMFYKKSSYGNIVLCYKHKRNFSKEDKSLCVSLGNSAAQALTIHKLYQNLKDFRDRLDRTVDAIIIFDPDTYVTEYVNFGAETLTGYKRNQLLKKSPFEWLFDSVSGFKKVTAPLTAGEVKSLTFESSMTSKTGELIPMEIFLQLINTPDQPPKFLTIAHNILKRKTAEEQIQRLMRQKDEFIGIASHELRTPITSLKGFAQLLQMRTQGKDGLTDHFVSRINSQVDKLGRLVNDLLDVSRIEQGKMIFKKELLDLNQLVHEVVEDARLTTTEHDIVLAGNVKKKIYGDRDRLNQAFTNIISNAIKYSPLNKKIVVKLRQRGDSALVMIRDLGIGIPRSHQKRIFDKFFQSSSTAKNPAPGLGLGLFITREIINRHGGTVSVQSFKGRGTKFYVRINNYDAKRKR